MGYRDGGYEYDQRSVANAILRQLEGAGPSGYSFDNYVGSEWDENRIPLGISRLSFNQLISKFDVSKIPDYHNMATPMVGHIIFTRPDLYLSSQVAPYSKGAPTYMSTAVNNPNVAWGDPDYNTAAMCQHPMAAGFLHSDTGRALLSTLMDEDGNSPYLPLFTTRAMNYNTSDFTLKNIEVGRTFYGQSMKYGHFSDEHKVGGTITIDFRNDYYFSVLRTVYLWMVYIYLVSKTDLVRPKASYQRCGILDYCGSIYYLVTLADRRTLVYWEKLTGVFPKTAPFNIFSYADAPFVEDKVSVEFDYAMRSDPCDPEVLFDINMLSRSFLGESVGGDYNQAAANAFWAHPTYGTSTWVNQYTNPSDYASPFHVNNALAKCPIIHSDLNPMDGSLGYYLEWRRAY